MSNKQECDKWINASLVEISPVYVYIVKKSGVEIYRNYGHVSTFSKGDDKFVFITKTKKTVCIKTKSVEWAGWPKGE